MTSTRNLFKNTKEDITPLIKTAYNVGNYLYSMPFRFERNVNGEDLTFVLKTKDDGSVELVELDPDTLSDNASIFERSAFNILVANKTDTTEVAIITYDQLPPVVYNLGLVSNTPNVSSVNNTLEAGSKIKDSRGNVFDVTWEGAYFKTNYLGKDTYGQLLCFGQDFMSKDVKINDTQMEWSDLFPFNEIVPIPQDYALAFTADPNAADDASSRMIVTDNTPSLVSEVSDTYKMGNLYSSLTYGSIERMTSWYALAYDGAMVRRYNKEKTNTFISKGQKSFVTGGNKSGGNGYARLFVDWGSDKMRVDADTFREMEIVSLASMELTSATSIDASLYGIEVNHGGTVSKKVYRANGKLQVNDPAEEFPKIQVDPNTQSEVPIVSRSTITDAQINNYESAQMNTQYDTFDVTVGQNRRITNQYTPYTNDMNTNLGQTGGVYGFVMVDTSDQSDTSVKIYDTAVPLDGTYANLSDADYFQEVDKHERSSPITYAAALDASILTNEELLNLYITTSSSSYRLPAKSEVSKHYPERNVGMITLRQNAREVLAHSLMIDYRIARFNQYELRTLLPGKAVFHAYGQGDRLTMCMAIASSKQFWE